MKISKRIISAFLIVSMLFSTIYTVLANEKEDLSSKISAELLDKIGISYEDIIVGDFEETGETYSCIVWIKDVDLELAVEAGVNAAEQVKEDNLSMAEYTYSVSEKVGAMLVDVVLDEDADDEYVQTYIDTEREKAVEMYVENNNRFVLENFKMRDISVKYVSSYSPCIFVELNISGISSLLLNKDVNYIGYLGEEEYFNADEETMSSAEIQSCLNLMRINEAKSAYGISGSGVKIGQIEGACPTAQAVIKNPDYDNTQIEGLPSTHADDVYSLMHTIAPGAIYYASGMYSSNTSIFQGNLYEQIEWLLSQGVNIINMSASNSNQKNKYTEAARWVDHIAYNHDVHFVNAAGNSGSEGVGSPGMAYNIITVGNTNWTGTYEIGEYSSYNNEGISRTEQRTYKPDVVAPASWTSYATPMVTGTVALLCELNPALKTKQPIVKSILAAGAGARTRNYVTIDTDFKKYGAGIVDALASSYIVAANQYSTSTGILSTTVGEAKTYNMEVSSSDSRMRIAMTYSNRINLGTSSGSHATATIPDGTIAEVGLYVYDPNGKLVAACVGDSRVVGTNLRIVEFDTNGNTGTYTIQVRLLAPASGGRSTNFGVAWW